jgi:hypothetical protein
VGEKIDALLEKGEKRTAKEMNQAQLQGTFGAMTIDYSEFTISEKEKLGSGAFATVYGGRYSREECAVKVFDLSNLSVEEQTKLKKSMVKELQVMSMHTPALTRTMHSYAYDIGHEDAQFSPTDHTRVWLLRAAGEARTDAADGESRWGDGDSTAGRQEAFAERRTEGADHVRDSAWDEVFVHQGSDAPRSEIR